MASAVVATVTDVVTRAQEFLSLATGSYPAYTSVTISLAIADASLMMNNTVWGPLAELAQTYLAAHLLTIRNPQLALPAGPVSEDRVGEVSSKYAVASGPVTESNYSASRWGREYLTLQRMIPQTRFAVT